MKTTCDITPPFLLKSQVLTKILVVMENFLLAVKASTTEEPGEGKLHTGICAGASGNGWFYRDCV